MTYSFIKSILNEEKQPGEKLKQVKLPYARGDLDPAVSEDTVNYHYGKLYKGYVDRFNKGEGDADFNEAGAFLHSILFAQYQAPEQKNEPTGAIAEFIDRHYSGGIKELKEEFERVAMAIQGSGWVYLAKNGQVKTIKNHQIKSDIVLLIDWWEHAMYDYKWDKKGYLENQWKIINWEYICKIVPGK